ncbi:MAG: glycosyltransferase family 2 protein [Thermoanaerobaculia bacterium]|nr:glycosyltransferase family 2 protein [Thermoanaerobaculia bacterium]
MKLAIAIPALNEEESIGQTISACLKARDGIVAEGGVTDVEIVVVSDGSTDRTLEIARGFEPDVRVIEFRENRGYGTAIQEAWASSDADLLAFLDADGTCDPAQFGKMCAVLIREKADIVLGSRMGPGSQMPFIRRVGNVGFAALVTALSLTHVGDTASGMRVVRRSGLTGLLPLPTGMSFTPAMSSRALLGGRHKLVEVPMPYSERAGKSKLRVLKDGARFLHSILEAALLYRGDRLLLAASGLCLALAAALMMRPVLRYAGTASLEEWMVYRFIVSNMLGCIGLVGVLGAYVAARVIRLSLYPERPPSHALRLGDWLFRRPSGLVLSALAATLATLLVYPAAVDLLTTGHTLAHWSRFITAAFLGLVVAILLGGRYARGVLDLLDAEVEYRGKGTKDRRE